MVVLVDCDPSVPHDRVITGDRGYIPQIDWDTINDALLDKKEKTEGSIDYALNCAIAVSAIMPFSTGESGVRSPRKEQLMNW